MKLLIATHNSAKVKELTDGLEPLKRQMIQTVTLADLGIDSSPEETAETFEKNAVLKARYYARLSNLATLADDGGLSIPVLNGEPGTKSRRWLGKDASDEELIQFTLRRLSGLALKNRSASLCLSLTYFNPKTQKVVSVNEDIQGYIAEKQSIKFTKGFPYRALFIVARFKKYYDELTEKEHEIINHRLKAVRRISEFIKKDLIQ
ncbi:MAG: non-canonical purine NTP pyrophosphatase [Patescibacteria group bacterium]